jgi:vacuolar-type H+-ATPase subunit H
MTDAENVSEKRVEDARSEARDLLRSAHIWSDTKGEPPAMAVEIVASHIESRYADGVREGLSMGRETAETVRAKAQEGVERTSKATATTRTFQEALANYLEAGAVGGACDIIAAIDARIKEKGGFGSRSPG